LLIQKADRFFQNLVSDPKRPSFLKVEKDGVLRKKPGNEESHDHEQDHEGGTSLLLFGVALGRRGDERF
jgi:hypothetical protein